MAGLADEVSIAQILEEALLKKKAHCGPSLVPKLQ
jgi:hypothetical protein